MKDPAGLLYSQDLLTGTMLMSNEQVGKYIKLLCLQHQNGKLSEDDMLTICGQHDPKIWAKFRIDETGYYFNERMLMEAQKRSKFCESRRNIRQSYVKHTSQRMENENENENEILIEKRNYKNIPPQLSEISERMKERDITSFTPEAFFAHYSSNGWMVGKTKMKDWDAALTTWKSRDNTPTAKASLYPPKYRTYDEMCQLALNNRDIWQQMTALKIPDMPKTVWLHPNDVVKHNLKQYEVK